MINFLHHIECIFGQIFFHVGISSLVTSQLMEVLAKSPIVPVVCSMQSCKRIPYICTSLDSEAWTKAIFLYSLKQSY
jgi:hypothetical protein